MERPETNRLVEDRSFYDGIINELLRELEETSRVFDHQNEELGYGRIWEKKITDIKEGIKISDTEREIRTMLLDISFKRGLSDTERKYLTDSIFKPPKYRRDNND